jgi:hypothetical protein
MGEAAAWEPDNTCPTFDVIWAEPAIGGLVQTPAVRCRVCKDVWQLRAGTLLNDFFNILGQHFHGRSGHYLVLHNRRPEEEQQT